MIERGLHDYLAGAGGVNAMVGPRVHPLAGPQPGAAGSGRVVSQSDYPRINYGRISTRRQYDLDQSDGLPIAIFEISMWGGRGAGGYFTAKKLAEEVRKILDGYSGVWGDEKILGCFVRDERDAWEQPEFASEDDVRGVVMNVEIRFRETVPTFA